jgi:hypothetical protein
MSGLGREGSRHGLEEYLDLRYVCLGGLSPGPGTDATKGPLDTAEPRD